MTTDVIRIHSPDLYVPNESWNPDARIVRRMLPVRPSLTAVTYIATSESPADSLDALAARCRARLEPLLYDDGQRDVQMLVADGPWQTPSALVKKKKLWARNPWALDTAQFSRLSGEIMVEREGRIRYAGLATVARRGFGLAVEIARKSRACAIFVSRSAPVAEADLVRSLFSAAFPSVKGLEATVVDWTRLALGRCETGDILVRVSGQFDDTSAAIDLIFDPEVNAAASL